GSLYSFDDFVKKLLLEEGACHFLLPIYQRDLEINIPKAAIDECTAYEDSSGFKYMRRSN
ncbi:MAG: hypothetical protein LBG04_02780, partial [Holosporaceae bacterium]|nr:hypothetical protein [Holosporaceae bacterium]